MEPLTILKPLKNPFSESVVDAVLLQFMSGQENVEVLRVGGEKHLPFLPGNKIMHPLFLKYENINIKHFCYV